MRRLGMPRKRIDEDHNFLATIRTPHTHVERVLCKVWLPRRATDDIRMEFHPTQRQADELLAYGKVSPFSIEARIPEMSGNMTTIRAGEVWARGGIGRRSAGKRRRVTVFEADPIDLRIFTSGRSGQSRQRKIKTYVDYLLTPSRELTPWVGMIQSWTGEVKIEDKEERKFTLYDGRSLHFLKRYHYVDQGEDETLVWRDLVAQDARDLRPRDIAIVDGRAMKAVDDFLLIVTFASRHRVVCAGIQATSETGDRFQYYRKNMAVPELREQRHSQDGVIPLGDFEEFVKQAYESFIASGPHELVRHALQLVMPRQDRTVESEFTTLFAALETLVLWYRRDRDLQFIIEDDGEWKAFRGDAQKWIKGHALFSGDKTRREMMNRKLAELRRVPFSIAFEHFCRDYTVQLEDLWPVLGKSSEMPLSEIRNQIVHGSTLEWSQWLALVDAREHLRWTVERMLLAIFRWPVERSHVRPSFLSHFTPMTDFAESRRAMQGMVAAPTASEETQ